MGSKQISIGHLKVTSVEINQRHGGWRLKIETHRIQQKCLAYNTIGIYKAEEPEIVAGSKLARLRDMIFRFMKDCEKSNI